MEFSDLNDEIGADDWLIPRQEITRRRLVKQTPRYNVFKADWFGEVLVYEPMSSKTNTFADQSGKSDDLVLRRQTRYNYARDVCDQDDFKSRLSELCLNLNTKADQMERCKLSLLSNGDGDEFDQQQADSAYSSISSTPQFYNKTHEFQFPSQQHQHYQPDSPMTSSYCSMNSFASTNDSKKEQQQQQQQQDNTQMINFSPASDDNVALDRKSHKQQAKSEPSTPPVILNKNSFFFQNSATLDNSGAATSSGATSSTISSSSSSSSWFELNELRLVAHENFLLFMGASLDQDTLLGGECSSQNTSLVMQMSHPKSLSLFDLLHAGQHQLTSTSPIDRFFANGSRHRQHLNLAAKLNICQQVTNAMTYLHDKNIVHGRLTSVNIYIELNQRVKISLLDNDELPLATCGGESQTVDEKGKLLEGNGTVASVSFNLPALTYLSPELVKTIRIETNRDLTCAAADYRCHGISKGPAQASKTVAGRSNVQIDTSFLTKESDIYSFGTLLYELFEEKFPFATSEQETGSPLFRQSATTTLSSHNLLDATELFEQLCLASHSATRRLSPDAPSLIQQLSPSTMAVKKRWNGNIKYSASELIFQIGSGQIVIGNHHRNKCPALVDQIISACWSAEAQNRPSFKQLFFK